VEFTELVDYREAVLLTLSDTTGPSCFVHIGYTPNGSTISRKRRCNLFRFRRYPAGCIVVFGRSLSLKKFLVCQSDVAGDFTKQSRRNVAPRVKRNCRAASIGMPVLPVRSALTNFLKTQSHQKSCHFARLQNG
jgi:hypothetical protein